MLEYKREKAQLESRLDDLRSKYQHYDDHMRIIDAWWLQVRCAIPLLVSFWTFTYITKLLQEVQLLAENNFTNKFEGEGTFPADLAP